MSLVPDSNHLPTTLAAFECEGSFLIIKNGFMSDTQGVDSTRQMTCNIRFCLIATFE